PSWLQKYDYANLNHPEKPSCGGALNVSGPMLNQSMQIFGTKLCLALHYEHAKKIVPSSGNVAIRWFSNYEKLTNQLPENIPDIFNGIGTLKQGQWDVIEQFEYTWGIAGDGYYGVYCC